MGVEGTDNAQKVTDLHLDCYAMLGVPPNAEAAVIHEAYETLAQRYDPEHFAGSPDEAQRKMSDLASAYEILSDPVRRRRYDLHRRIDAWTAPVSANETSRREGPPVAVVDESDVAPRSRRYPVLLSAALAALVVVAAVTAYRYSGRPKEERQASTPAAQPVAAEAQPASATRPTAPTAETPARPPDDAASGVTTPPPPPQAAATLPQETRPAPPKSPVAKSSSANRPASASPAAAGSEPCGDVATVLGLCKRSSNVKDK
jgi:curved DNA-binding protein CbpA